PLPEALTRRLTFAADNPNSILSCVARARANARGVRGQITAEMWRELNKLHLQFAAPDVRARAAGSPHEFCQAVECASHLFQGACDAALMHDEGWQFIQVGKFLERAEKTLRILDVQYRVFGGPNEDCDPAVANWHWVAVLRGCRAY